MTSILVNWTDILKYFQNKLYTGYITCQCLSCDILENVTYIPLANKKEENIFIIKV